MDSNTAALVSLRHHQDCQTLHSAERFDNAGYLAGYVVECGLKTLLLRPGMPGAKQLGHDLQLMAGNALFLAIELAPGVRRYSVPNSPDFRGIIAEWRPEERYNPIGKIDRVKADSRIRACNEIFDSIIVPCLLDGSVRYQP